MDKKALMKNVVALAVILAVVFLSQQPQIRPVSKNLYSTVLQQANSYWLKASEWLKTTLYPEASREVTKRGQQLQHEATVQKNNFFQNLWERIKSYLAKKFSKTFGTNVH